MAGETKILSPDESTEVAKPSRSKLLSFLQIGPDFKEPKKDKQKPPTKVVIRRLPPKITKEALLEVIGPLPDHNYFKLKRGDLSLGIYSFSTAYIDFGSQDAVFAFKDKFDDYLFKDEKGKEFFAIVEFSTVQKIPRKSQIKKKLPKSGTIEQDPQYIEFLQKLEEGKNAASSTSSEHFQLTLDNASPKTEITTTPLLEYLKLKKQKKIDIRNEQRSRRKEAEIERRKKDEERRKVERERRKEEKIDRKSSNRAGDDKTRRNEDVKEKMSEEGTKLAQDVPLPPDPAILKVVVRQTDGEVFKDSSSKKPTPKTPDETSKGVFSYITPVVGPKKYSSFRTKTFDEKQKKLENTEKPFKNDGKKSEESWKKVKQEEKIESTKKQDKSYEQKKSKDLKSETKYNNTETKSWYRYSEQRNRNREGRNTKLSENKESKISAEDKVVAQCSNSEDTFSNKHDDDDRDIDFMKLSTKLSNLSTDSESRRRKSLEYENDGNLNERRRSKSLQDESLDDDEKTSKTNENSETDSQDGKKDPRVERRIRNKDRPSIQIYRPGMGKFSKQRIDQKKEEPTCTNLEKTKSNCDKEGTKTDGSEVKTRTFKRSVSKEN